MIDCVTCPGGSNSYGWYSYHRHAPLFSLSLFRLVLRQEYLFMPPFPCDSNMASFSSSWSGLFFISILITFFSLQGDVSELTWVIVFSFLVRYCLWRPFLFLSLFFFSTSNEQSILVFFLYYLGCTWQLWAVCFGRKDYRSHSGFGFLLYLNLKADYYRYVPFLPPSLPCYLNHV